MAYTTITQKTTVLKATHVAELKQSLDTLATDKNLAVSITLDTSTPKAANMTALQAAINSLESSFSNNCCQANCCQTCQTCQGCQKQCSCQTCQACMN